MAALLASAGQMQRAELAPWSTGGLIDRSRLRKLGLAAILVDTLLLGLHAQPNAIELDDCWDLADRVAMHLSQPGFQLIDAAIRWCAVPRSLPGWLPIPG